MRKSPEAKERGRAYARAYYHRHKERVLAYRAAHPEVMRRGALKWRRKHPEKVRQLALNYRRHWPELAKASQRLWHLRSRLMSARYIVYYRLNRLRVPKDIRAELLKKLLGSGRCCYCGAEVSFMLAEILAGGKRQAQIEHLHGRQHYKSIADYEVACSDCNNALGECPTLQAKLDRIAEARAALAGNWLFTQDKPA